MNTGDLQWFAGTRGGENVFVPMRLIGKMPVRHRYSVDARRASAELKSPRYRLKHLEVLLGSLTALIDGMSVRI